MLTRVLVMEGQLMIGNLVFNLTRLDDGKREIFNFRGYGSREGGVLCLLRYGDFGPVSEYVIASEPTPESREFEDGYTFAERQRTKRRPSAGKSEHFRAGWRLFWEDREREQESQERNK